VTEIANILALSALHEAETSALTHDSLSIMLGNAFHYATARAGVDGYLISFDQDANYHGINFLWFKSRYLRFVYIDRVVVAANARGKGIARSFYDELIRLARAANHEYIMCEINTFPPNDGSMAFHRAMGFTEVGKAEIGRQKTVSYQALAL
jgi:uncharacterized protein